MLKGFVKTLFGDLRNMLVAAGCILLGAGLLHTPFAACCGLVFPVLVLAGAIYLAWH